MRWNRSSEGLVKEIDTTTEVKFTFYHGTINTHALKGILVLLAFLIDKYFIKSGQGYHRAVLLLVLYLIYNLVTINKKESVSYTNGFGIQLSSRTGQYLPISKSNFIPSKSIVDVVIIEGFKGLQVVYYLALIVKDEPKLVRILPDAGLRINDLKAIRHDIRKLMLK